MIEEPLAGRIQGGGGFIQQAVLPLGQQEPGEGQPLLFTEGEDRRPVADRGEAAEALQQRFELHLAQHRFEEVVREVGDAHAIQHLAAKRTEHQIRSLRQKRQPGHRRAVNPAGACVPEAGDDAEHGALAGAAGAGDQERLAGRQGKGKIFDQRLVAMGCQDGHVRERNAVSRLVPLDRGTGVTHIRRRVARLNRLQKCAQAADDGPIRKEDPEVRDENVERAEHLGERDAALDHQRDGDFSIEEQRGHEDGGQDANQIVVTGGEKPQIPVPVDNPQQIVERRFEALAHARLFNGFILVKGDGFHILPDVDQFEPEIGFFFQLIETQINQGFPDKIGDERAADRAQQHRHQERDGNVPEDPREDK